MKIKIYIFSLFLIFFTALSTYADTQEPFGVTLSPETGDVNAGGNFNLNIELSIAPDHFLYKDKTRVEIEEMQGFITGETSFPAPEVKYDKFLNQDIEIYKKHATISQNISTLENIKPGKYNLKLNVFYQGCKAATCFLPQMKTLSFPVNVFANNEVLSTNKIENPDVKKTSFEKTIESKGLFGALVLAFIAGIGLSFTPCIYPMIPITVAIIGGQATNKPLKGFYLSLIYVLGISVVYSALGVAAASTGALFGSAVNSPWVVGFVALVFFALAFSMFGVYELKLPTAMAEKFGGKKGSGVLGIFFMGLISGTVASPCVGPILVSMLVFIASSGSKLLGFWLLFVFSWGMGMLLIAVGTFSGTLNLLPKSGTWMVMVKKIMGILLIGAAFYYIKGVIPEKIFLITLGIFLITVGVFSGGMDRLVAESTILSRVKKSFGILCVIFGIYFLVGTLLLKGLLLSPLTFSLAENVNNSINRVESYKESGIEWMLSESSGLKLAKESSKPAMMDFWAEWCSVCKKLDKKTLHDPTIVSKSKNFINIKIDCTDVDDPEIKALWAKYGIVGLPTIIFVDKNGNILKDKSVNGFKKPDDFIKIMDSIL